MGQVEDEQVYELDEQAAAAAEGKDVDDVRTVADLEDDLRQAGLLPSRPA